MLPTNTTKRHGESMKVFITQSAENKLPKAIIWHILFTQRHNMAHGNHKGA